MQSNIRYICRKDVKSVCLITWAVWLMILTGGNVSPMLEKMVNTSTSRKQRNRRKEVSNAGSNSYAFGLHEEY